MGGETHEAANLPPEITVPKSLVCTRVLGWSLGDSCRTLEQVHVMSIADQPAFAESAATSERRRELTIEQALESSPGRVRDIAALRGLGFTYREIGRHYGVTPQAISLLLIRCRRNMKAIGGRPQMANLSTRATNALRRLGIESREEAIAANVLGKLAHARNCGRKTLNEIECWIANTSP